MLATAFYPAIDDPKFAGSGLDPGYFTTVPGDRVSLFYGADDSDPAVVAADEAGKDVVSVTGLSQALQAQTTGISGDITVPVLIIMGGDDAIACGPITPTQNIDCASPTAVAAAETPLYQARRACTPARSRALATPSPWLSTTAWRTATSSPGHGPTSERADRPPRSPRPATPRQLRLGRNSSPDRTSAEYAETSRIRRRKLTTIIGNCPGCPVHGGEFPRDGDFAALFRGQLSTTRKLSAINPIKRDLSS